MKSLSTLMRWRLPIVRMGPDPVARRRHLEQQLAEAKAQQAELHRSINRLLQELDTLQR